MYICTHTSTHMHIHLYFEYRYTRIRMCLFRISAIYGRWTSGCSIGVIIRVICETFTTRRTGKCCAKLANISTSFIQGQYFVAILLITRILMWVCAWQSTCCKISVHGQWEAWESWLGCSKTCGGGITRRERTCDAPTAEFGGRFCIGGDAENIDVEMVEFATKACNTDPCPGKNIVVQASILRTWIIMKRLKQYLLGHSAECSFPSNKRC